MCYSFISECQSTLNHLPNAETSNQSLAIINPTSDDKIISCQSPILLTIKLTKQLITVFDFRKQVKLKK